MSDFPCDDGPHRRPHTALMAAPFFEFDLGRELEQLRGEPEWSRGQNAKTIVKYEDFRIVLIALRTGAKLPDHRTRGRISLIALDHDLPHDVEALEESACLLTIAWPRGREGQVQC